MHPPNSARMAGPPNGRARPPGETLFSMAVGAVVVIVTTVVTAVVPGVTLAGENAQEASSGSPEQAKVTD